MAAVAQRIAQIEKSAVEEIAQVEKIATKDSADIQEKLASKTADIAAFDPVKIETELAGEFARPRASTGESTQTPPEAVSVAGTGESAARKWNAEGITKYSEDGFVYVYEKVGNVVMVVRVRITEKYEQADALAMQSYAKMRGAADRYIDAAKGRAVLLQGQVSQGVLSVKVQLLAGRDTLLTHAGTGRDALVVRRKALTERAGAKLDVIKDQIFDDYERITVFIQEKIPAPVSNAFVSTSTKISGIALRVKGGCLYIYGTTATMTVAIKVKGMQANDLVRTKVSETLAVVHNAIEAYSPRVEGGLLSAKAKLQDVTVLVRAKGTETLNSSKAAALRKYAYMKEAIEGLPMTQTILEKVANGRTFVTGKADDVVVHMKDGYMHVICKVDDATLYMKAKVATVRGAAKVQILEAYTSTEHLALSLLQRLQKVVVPIKDKAEQKPVVAGATGGALLVGAGGGAAGSVAGGLAGATMGLPLAIFTFGLSIPIGAMVGGGAGACVGVAAGSATGAVGGSVAGYGYGRREQIKTNVGCVMEKAGSCSDKLKEAASCSVARVRARVA